MNCHLSKLAFILVCALGLFASGCSNQTDSKGVKSDTDAKQHTSNYDEKNRPQLHFSPPAHWMNDPNGMVYLDGEYHLFYQYYPDSTVWGPMHWAHAVSTDMVHWDHLATALYPDPLGYIFSGSAVVDSKNTSGLGTLANPPMIAIFTHHDMDAEKSGTSTTYQNQSLAFSTDKGRTWEKYANNPVLKSPNIANFRDPKVMWHEETSMWVMSLAANDRVKFYASPDLITWNYLSDFGETKGDHGGVWECPDLFPISVEGSTETYWVLLLSINPGGPNGGSATQYFVGHFDGKKFTIDRSLEAYYEDEKTIWLDQGRDNYAGVTWSGIPATDGRRLFLGWMSNWDYGQEVPTEKWRSAMTVPRELQLKKTRAGLRLTSLPVKELDKLIITESVRRSEGANSINMDAGNTIMLSDTPFMGRIDLEFAMSNTKSGRFFIDLSNDRGETMRIGYDAEENRFISDRRESGSRYFSEKFADGLHYAVRESKANKLKLSIIIDVASFELFADGGEVAMTEIFFPSEDYTTLSVKMEESGIELTSWALYPMKSIWR